VESAVRGELIELVANDGFFYISPNYRMRNFMNINGLGVRPASCLAKSWSNR
jgi:hypothetical protein